MCIRDRPYTVLDDIHEIEALPETTEKEIAYKNFRREAIKPYKPVSYTHLIAAGLWTLC